MTKTLAELELAFNSTIESFGGEVLHGVKNGNVFHEDGYPWFEVYGGRIGRKTADEFCQALANAMGCRVLLNSCSKEAIQGVMDFDEKVPDANGKLPPLIGTDVNDYGEEFIPEV